jgi:AhpD family alkylhydroperoxidase
MEVYSELLSGQRKMKPKRHYPWYIRLFFWNQKRRYGQELEPAKLWARSPSVFVTLALLYGAFDRKKSPIKPELRSLVTVRVSQINWCRFCVDINSMNVLKRGSSEAKLNDLAHFEKSDLFSDAEKAALHYAEIITYSDKHVTEEDRARLKQYFDEDAIIELTGLIGFQNMSSKFNSALDVAPQGFCQLPVASQIGEDANTNE